MGVLKGAMTVRRYAVLGEVPDDFRVRYADALADHAFRDPPASAAGEERSGWCRIDNLLETDFSDLNRWLFNQYLVAALRTDKKVLPAKLFRAHLDRRLAEWCHQHGRNRAPSGVRQEIREQLEIEMFARTLPRVQVVEWVWNLVDGWVAFHNTSDSANDRFVKLFRETFGLELAPFSPLDFLADDPDLAAALEAKGISDYRRPHREDA